MQWENGRTSQTEYNAIGLAASHNTVSTAGHPYKAQGHCYQVGHLKLVVREDQIATIAKLCQGYVGGSYPSTGTSSETQGRSVHVGYCLGGKQGVGAQRRADGDHLVRVSWARSVYGERFSRGSWPGNNFAKQPCTQGATHVKLLGARCRLGEGVLECP